LHIKVKKVVIDCLNIVLLDEEPLIHLIEAACNEILNNTIAVAAKTSDIETQDIVDIVIDFCIIKVLNRILRNNFKKIIGDDKE